MPRNFEIPDDMAEFLDEWAPKEQKADAHALLLDLIERYRSQKRSAVNARKTPLAAAL